MKSPRMKKFLKEERMKEKRVSFALCGRKKNRGRINISTREQEVV